MIGIIIALIVAFLWSIGEVKYSEISKKQDKTNVYLYTFFLRTIIYLGVVLLFQHSLIGSYEQSTFDNMLPIILCDLFASIFMSIAFYNGKLSVVSPIMAAYPIIDILLGIVILKEKASIFEVILVILISISIIILASNQRKTRNAPNPKKGILFSFLHMLLVALSTYFEKTMYMSQYTIFDLYYYKGSVYLFASFVFAMIILLGKNKIKKPNKDFIKGCGIIPVGNILFSYALTTGSMMIVTPISSLYSVITHYISRFHLKEKITVLEKACIITILSATILLITLKIL